MRQIVLDTETTGLEVSQGHRIIEIGCIELVNRRVTGNHWHYYFNPDREVDIGAFEVHGISNEFLLDKPQFAELAEDFYSYVKGAELVIHNAAFDVGFLNRELSRLDDPLAPLEDCCAILDTLMLARQKHPGQKNNLDALCKRYDIDNSQRSLHGALLDARILADVYLAMTGGQTSFGLEADQTTETDFEQVELRRSGSGQSLPLWQIDDASLQANREYIEFLASQHDDPAWK
jgi:DNA polymerase-3 subunit epsilon